MIEIYVLADDYAGYSSKMWAQHGVSYLIESPEGTVLFDTGTFGGVVLRNMRELRKDPKEIDAIVLSHCHYDHTGGLLKILEELMSSVPIFAHPKLFRSCFSYRNSIQNVGVPEGFQERCEKLGAYWVLSEKPKEVLKGIFTTGEIRRELEPIPKSDCYTIVEGKMVKDEMPDDMGIVIDLEGSSFLITGCTHSGILNMCKRAKEVTKKPLKGIMGGLHLLKESEESIVRACKGLKDLGISEVYVGHCTGLLAECIMMKEYKEKFHKIFCGMQISLR